MLGRQFFCFELTLKAAGAHQYDLRTQRFGCLALDLRSIIRHHNDSFHPQRPCRVGNSLRMIAAGIGDDPALSLAGDREAILLYAPRSLNAPMGCWFSGFR